jgi:phosphatidylserine decarboxylase
VPEFIRKFRIPMGEYQEKEFTSFNDFFIRKFRPDARPFTQVSGELPAFAEARYYAFASTGPGQEFPVKGMSLSAEVMLGSAERARPFVGGPCLLARLCPVDYHRFHYPDDGTTIEQLRLPGRLHSVNPVALRYKGDILVTNERQVSLLETRNFGKLAYIEIGALCVGRIVQTHPTDEPFKRGDEKGYFLFGGSSVAVLGEPGAWKPDQDLLEQTAMRRETLVRLGERVAHR